MQVTLPNRTKVTLTNLKEVGVFTFGDIVETRLMPSGQPYINPTVIVYKGQYYADRQGQREWIEEVFGRVTAEHAEGHFRRTRRGRK